MRPYRNCPKFYERVGCRYTRLIDGNERATASAVNLNERFNTDAESFE